MDAQASILGTARALADLPAPVDRDLPGLLRHQAQRGPLPLDWHPADRTLCLVSAATLRTAVSGRLDHLDPQEAKLRRCMQVAVTLGGKLDI